MSPRRSTAGQPPGDRKRWLEPVTQAVSHQAAGRSRPVAFAHNESVKIHMAR